MKYLLFLLISVTALWACNSVETEVSPEAQTTSNETTERLDYALAIHGGAGVIKRANMTEEYEAEVREVLAKALEIGEATLKAGQPAELAVIAVISYLEDMPQFNAGKGAVFTYEGTNELDASIMRGKDLSAGAISGVTGVKHPIQLAQKVMDESVHVMLSGAGAQTFAKEQGLEIVDPSYFHTDRRYESWKKARAKADAKPQLSDENGKFGTVGCVAMDQEGHLAAGTSTGGMTLKRWGRIGDAPVIGAGTYADDRTCAVSATGHGEFFIRYAVAHDVSARMLHGNKTLAEAGDAVIQGELKKVGGDGGIISVDRTGKIHMPFNTAGMYRGFVTPTNRGVAIFDDETF
ncbi:MAG: isoaspartyl peptidase/L-asparaginase family protein [Saprospiraceae bacterium]